MKKGLFSLTCIIIMLAQSGCYDKIELENRGFVISMGIDVSEDEGNFLISMAYPDVSVMAKPSGDDETKSIKKASGNTVSEAIHEIDSFSSRYTDLGNMKLCVISGDILSDEWLLRELVDTLERNTDISKRIILMATDGKAEEILKAKIPGEPLVGLYVDNYFKNNSSGFKSDLESVVRNLRSSGTTLLPKIALEDEEIKIGGAAMIKDFSLAGFINENDLRGYLWLKGEASHVSAIYNDSRIPLKITRESASQSFAWENERLICQYKIRAEGYIEEYMFSDNTLFDNVILNDLAKIYSDEVRSEIMKTWEIFYKDYRVDGLALREALRKKEYEVYQRFEQDFEAVFDNMELQLDVNVEIRNTGTIR